MARPTTKKDLIIAANEQFELLFDLIDELSETEQLAPFNFSDAFLEKKKEAHWRRDQNLRDVLIHLYEWQQLQLNWVASNQAGDEQPFLPAPYNWRTYGALNEQFVAEHQETDLATAKASLKKSHQEIMALLDSFSNQELYAKKQFKWTGTSTLGTYFSANTSSHYLWAIKKLKPYVKEQKKSRTN